jgi:30S ribosomal protein S31
MTRTARKHGECIEVVSQPRITPEGKAQVDSKAQHTRKYVSISIGLQRRHRGLEGVIKPLLISGGTEMGRGDRRTKRGKIWRGTHGNTRPKKKKVTEKNAAQS